VRISLFMARSCSLLTRQLQCLRGTLLNLLVQRRVSECIIVGPIKASAGPRHSRNNDELNIYRGLLMASPI
jgi:hypothetical protein